MQVKFERQRKYDNKRNKKRTEGNKQTTLTAGTECGRVHRAWSEGLEQDPAYDALSYKHRASAGPERGNRFSRCHMASWDQY